jgi:hypothetical protein
MYQDPSNIPDILIIVDDDTSVDIETVQLWMSEAKGPRVGNPCAGGFMSVDGSPAGMGGAGTFFNRAAIERLSEPLYCDNPKHESITQPVHAYKTIELESKMCSSRETRYSISSTNTQQCLLSACTPTGLWDI